MPSLRQSSIEKAFSFLRYTKGMLLRFYVAILLIIFVGIVFHAPLSVGLGTLFPDYDLPIKSWKEILMLGLIPLAGILMIRHRLWRLFNDWTIRAIIAYGVLHIFLAIVMWQGLAPTLAGLAIDLRYLLFFDLVYLGMILLPAARRQLLVAVTLGAFLVVVFATLQLFLPIDILSHIGYSKATIAPYLTVDQNPNYIRVNSTLRGPNPLGAYAGMVLALLAAAMVKNKVKLRGRKAKFGVGILGVCSLVALWISYSRSAVVAAVVGVFVVILSATLRRISGRAWLAAIVMISVLAGGLIAARSSDFVSNVVLHENLQGGSGVNSNEGHVTSLQYGLVDLASNPWGSGVGSTGSASLLGDNSLTIENQYLFVGHEVGWIGLALFLLIFCLVMVRLWRQRADWLALGVFGSGVALALIGLLLPVWTDDTVSIIWWGLAAIALAGGKSERTARQ